MKLISLFPVAVGLTLAATAWAGNWFSSKTSGTPLARAHQAYLQGDFLAMDLALKETLMAPGLDAATRANALDLFEKGYTATGGHLPADWKLPAELTSLNLFVRHARRGDGEVYGVKVTGTGHAIGIVKELRLTRYPDQVLLDKEKGLGSWDDDSDHGDEAEFESHNFDLPKPPEEGLYFLDVELKSGATLHSWFPVTNLVASTTPTITVPTPGQVFTSATPRLEWSDFRSPELQPYEWRGLWLSAWPISGSGRSWERYIDDPSLTTLRVGEGGQGASRLSPGRYAFILVYREMRAFGEMRLGRQSFRSVNFSVK